ncbi:hypothetical protein EGR_02646 [Echinococcus granulosus]|uniref:C2H2-type domain-containing protein n=1 Tax=Echinococcus granulosus TaxID=6210 RepID=W6V7R6_ECHGR|nr:hypothetical protein EGR_02646 [Echinococcus granulosus]EUB62514.1 hypothetical protein EGR_02646 [Echinococcus granulosus]
MLFEGMNFKAGCPNNPGLSNFLTFNGSAASQPCTQPLMPSFALPLPGTQAFANPSVSSTGRQMHPNTRNATGMLSPPSTLPIENKQPGIDSSSAIGVYKKYYTDVLGYFKTLLDNLENVNASTTNRTQGIAPNNVQNGRSLDNDPWSHSKTVMEGYFRQSGARDWDWASWHNYLSWISRTHPEWFQLFSECSKQMGIDWDVMYQKWLASKSNTNDQAPVFDLSRPPPISTSNPQQAPPPPITNPFCLTSVPPPQDPRVWCEDCDKYYPTQKAYDIHLRGVCHIQNALTKTITNNASAVLDIPPPQWAPQVHPHHVEPAVPRNKPMVDLRPSQKLQLRIQYLLDICIQPLVGLNYITEFQRRGLLECVYVCDLCEKRAFLPSAVIKHVCSIRHRMAYLKYHYPPLHQLISIDRSPESIRKRRLTSYAQQVESSEGRKRLSIMVEKENSTFKTRIEPLEPKKVQGSPLAPAQNDKVLETSPRTELTDVVSKSTVHSSELGENNTNELGDDEIEEGEMLDCSTSSSSAPEDQEGLAKEGGMNSPASSHFSDEDGGGGEYDNSKLPSFFSAGVIESSDNRHNSIVVHLPDFEIGFVSERPLLPDFTADECTDFVERLRKEGLLGARRFSISEASEQQEKETTPMEVASTDSQLGRSFEEEARWALKQLENAKQKTNPLQFSFKSRSQITAPSTPLLPDPPAVLSSTLKATEVKDGDAKGVGGPSMMRSDSKNPESVKRAVKTLLGDFEPSSPPLQPPPGSRHGQTIPVIMSNQPRPLLPQPSHPASIPKRENSKVSVLGDPPKRLKLDQLDGVKSLLSSPLDALQALLKGNLGASSEQQQREENEASGSSAPTTHSPTNPSPCPTEIFDGYSYFSRQEEEELKTQERAPATKTPLISHRQRQGITKSATTNIATSQGRSSKLATFADMLGMNEPPAPPPPSRPPPPPTPVQPTVPQVPTAATAGILGAGLAPAAWLATPSLWQSPAVIPTQALATPSPSTAAAAALAAATGGFNPAAFRWIQKRTKLSHLEPGSPHTLCPWVVWIPRTRNVRPTLATITSTFYRMGFSNGTHSQGFMKSSNRSLDGHQEMASRSRQFRG